jgi:hypothetical protein
MNKFSFTISACVHNLIAIRYFCFNDIYPSCIHKERHLITLVVFFLILHIIIDIHKERHFTESILQVSYLYFPNGGRISIMSKTNTGSNSNEYY